MMKERQTTNVWIEILCLICAYDYTLLGIISSSIDIEVQSWDNLFKMKFRSTQK